MNKVNEDKPSAIPSGKVLKDNVSDAARRCRSCNGKSYTSGEECADCFGTGLADLVHYAADATGRPTCIEPRPATSTKADEVTCQHCLSVITQRQNMDMGDWLK